MAIFAAIRASGGRVLLGSELAGGRAATNDAGFGGAGALAVGACTESDHKGQDLAACQLEATKVYPHWRGNMDVGIRATSTYLCMKAKGYGYDDACLPESGADASAAALPTVGQPARRSSGMREGRDGWINETSEHCYRKAKVN